MTIAQAKERLDIPGVAAGIFPNWQPSKCCTAPWREDHKPSFSVFDEGRKWKDHGTGEGGDAIDFLEKALNLPAAEARETFLRMAAGGERHSVPREAAPAPRAPWPTFRPLEDAEDAELGSLRGLSVRGPKWAGHDRILWVCEWQGTKCWASRSACGKNAKLRRFDGRPFSNGAKALNLPGADNRIPVGRFADRRWPCVAIVEGEGDILAAYEAIFRLCLLDRVTVCGILGASLELPPEAAKTLSGRRCRIFQHHDAPGEAAADRWAAAILAAGGAVDIWTPDTPGHDLNDVFSLAPEDIIPALEEAFSFAKEEEP